MRVEDAATIAYAMSATSAEEGDWSAVERDLPASVELIDRGPPHLAMMTHALLGRAYAKHAGDKRASAEYAHVRAFATKLTGSFNDSPAQLKQWARGLDALGEAIVFAADENRDAAVWSRPPPYSGSGADSDVDAWIASKLQPWIDSRSSTILGVEAGYMKVLALPFPPPHWVVDSAARVAKMWADASDQLMSVPRTNGVRRSFTDKLAAVALPLRTRKAKPSALACVAFSAKYQYTDDGSAGCSAWLTKNFRAESPPLDEIVPRVRAGGADLVDPLYARASDVLPRP